MSQNGQRSTDPQDYQHVPRAVAAMPKEFVCGFEILPHHHERAQLIYATGHSRNGILMTPITGECTAALLTGEASPVDISVFSISRFSSPEQTSDMAN